MTHIPRLARLPLAACATLAGVLVPAAPGSAAADPSLSLDRACYAEGEPITFTATGFPAGARVDVLAVHAAQATSTGVRADRRGAATGLLRAPVHALGPGEDRGPLIVAADVLAFDAVPAVPVVAAAASRTVVLTRREATVAATDGPGVAAGRPLRVSLRGWTAYRGRSVYLVAHRGRRVTARVRLGALAGPCGDLRWTTPQLLAGLPGAGRASGLTLALDRRGRHALAERALAPAA